MKRRHKRKNKHNYKKNNKLIVLVSCLLVGFGILLFENNSRQSAVPHVLSTTDAITPSQTPPPWCYYANANCTVFCSNTTTCPPCPTSYLVCLTPTPTTFVP